MTNEIEAKLTIINRLLGSFPATGSGSADEIIDAFLIAVGDVPTEYLASAAARFLQGAVEDHNKKFAPSPAELSSEARKIWNRDARRIEQDRATRLQIEARDEALTPEEQERRKALVEKLLKTLPRTPDAERDVQARREKAEQTNEMFRARDPRTIEERLNLSRTQLEESAA